MNRKPITSIAPEIYRKRMVIDAYYNRDVDKTVIENYFSTLTNKLALRTYGPSIIHETGSEGKDENQGFDAFVPLIDSGIYIAVWKNLKFLSTVLYTCADFDEDLALSTVSSYFNVTQSEASLF